MSKKQKINWIFTPGDHEQQSLPMLLECKHYLANVQQTLGLLDDSTKMREEVLRDVKVTNDREIFRELSILVLTESR